MKLCLFCEIIKGKVPSLKVYEDKFVFAFAPLKEVILSKGHILVIPKRHFADIYDIPEKELNYVLASIKLIAKKLKKNFKVEGINILHASGKIAQQSIFHFHMHLIPRYQGEKLDVWPNTEYKEKNYLKVYRDIAKLF